ncbi:MAG: hypothetical protein WAO35_14160 [Terriglobia bacterium]
MKRLSPIPAVTLLSLVACGLDLARVFWLDVEILAAYWVEPFLFGLVMGFIFASVVFVIWGPNQSS